MMDRLNKLLVPRLEQLFYVLFFFFILSISPLMLAFYLLCWIRAQLTPLLYSNVDHTLMAGCDAAAGMEIDSKTTMVNIIMIVNSHLSVEEVKDLTMNNVISAKDRNNKPLFPKLTRCLTLRAGYLVWYAESNFNIDDHIRQFHGQPPLDETELKSVINHLCNNPLDLNKPRWEIVVIPTEYRDTGIRQTCLLFRVHHSFADGISLFRLVFEQLGGSHGAFQQILKQMEKKFQSIYTSVATPAAIYKMIFRKVRNHDFKIELSGINIYDWTSAIKMSKIRDIKNATCTTVNDVIVSCLAGACRKLLVRQGVHPPNFLESMMPVAFHNADDPIELKNELGGVVHQLPTGDMDCVQRLKATKSIMDELKRSPDISITRWILKHCFNTVPYTIMKWLCDTAGFHVIFSNVPGPMNKLLFNGHVIDSFFGLAQTKTFSHFGFCAVSYAGHLTVGLTVDTAIISTKEETGLVLRDFVQEVQNLYDAVVLADLQIKDTYAL